MNHKFSFPVEDCLDLLGMTIDNQLNFNEHVSLVCKKVNNQLMSWLDFVTSFVPLPSKSCIMLSFCPTFNIALRSGIFVVLETLINKRALRIVFYDKVSSYQQLLHKSKGATLYNRRIQNTLITIYKMLELWQFS